MLSTDYTPSTLIPYLYYLIYFQLYFEVGTLIILFYRRGIQLPVTSGILLLQSMAIWFFFSRSVLSALLTTGSIVVALCMLWILAPFLHVCYKYLSQIVTFNALLPNFVCKLSNFVTLPETKIHLYLDKYLSLQLLYFLSCLKIHPPVLDYTILS